MMHEYTRVRIPQGSASIDSLQIGNMIETTKGYAKIRRKNVVSHQGILHIIRFTNGYSVGSDSRQYFFIKGKHVLSKDVKEGMSLDTIDGTYVVADTRTYGNLLTSYYALGLESKFSNYVLENGLIVCGW